MRQRKGDHRIFTTTEVPSQQFISDSGIACDRCLTHDRFNPQAGRVIGGPAATSVATDSGTTRCPMRGSHSSWPDFPSRISGEASMTQWSVTGKFLREIFWSGLDRRYLEAPATEQEFFPRDPGEIRRLGLRDHPRLIPLQGSRKPQFPCELGWTQAQRAERGFGKVHFNLHEEALAQSRPPVTGILVMRMRAFRCMEPRVADGTLMMISSRIQNRVSRNWHP